MTEFWRSNPNHWCELCKCWMTDTKAARLNHERGMGHQENLKRKLRDMGKKADADKRNAASTEKALGELEASAAKQYAKDVAEQRAALGTWEWDDGAQYYYNAVQRWYYDPKTSWYYGGEPIAWTQLPPASLPTDAHFGVAAHNGGPIAQGAQGSQPAAAAASTSQAAANGAITTSKVQRVIHLPKHPMQDIGGHAMPSAGGRIGAGKGVGAAPSTSDAAAGAGGGAGQGGAGAAAGGKRGRDGAAAAGKAVSAEEAAALARREAARQRVSARTMTTYGLS